MEMCQIVIKCLNTWKVLFQLTEILRDYTFLLDDTGCRETRVSACTSSTVPQFVQRGIACVQSEDGRDNSSTTKEQNHEIPKNTGAMPSGLEGWCQYPFYYQTLVIFQ